MALTFTIHLLAVLVVAVTASVLAGWALVRDPVDGRDEFVVLAGLTGIWTVTTGWMMFIDTEIGLQFGYYVQLFLQWISPAMFLYFVLSYSKNEFLLNNIAVKLYLFGIPLLFLALTFTEPVHELLYTDAEFITEPFGSVLPLSLGPVFYLGLIYMYVNLVIGLIFIARFSVRSDQVSNRQVAAVAFFVVIVVLTGLFELVGLVPHPGFDYVLVSFGGFYAALGYLFLRNPALDIGPLARQQVIQELFSPVIILTSDYKIADYNKSANVAFSELNNSIGEQVTEKIPELIPDSDEERDFAESLSVRVGDDQYDFQLSVSEITKQDEIRGYGLIFSDVTDIREYSRQLEKKSKQLDQFASMVSHDLRAPITSAKTNIGFALAQAEEESETSNLLEKSIESLDRGEELIEDLLTLAREGKAIQERVTVPLKELAEKAAETSPLDTEQYSISISDTEVYCDEERMRTVLENLLRNASDHVGEDVKVQIGELEGQSGIYVEDDGPGIPEEKLDEIFEHGYTTNSKGTGLGLSIVQDIVEAHGWQIEVTNESSLGGARFIIHTN